MGAGRLAPVVPQTPWASWQAIVGVFVALIAGYTTIHFSVRRFVPDLNRWLGTVVAVAPVLLLFVFGDGIG